MLLAVSGCAEKPQEPIQEQPVPEAVSENPKWNVDWEGENFSATIPCYIGNITDLNFNCPMEDGTTASVSISDIRLEPGKINGEEGYMLFMSDGDHRITYVAVEKRNADGTICGSSFTTDWEKCLRICEKLINNQPEAGQEVYIVVKGKL